MTPDPYDNLDPVMLAWVDACVEASYPLEQRWEAKAAARRYLDWLESLPTLEPASAA